MAEIEISSASEPRYTILLEGLTLAEVRELYAVMPPLRDLEADDDDSEGPGPRKFVTDFMLHLKCSILDEAPSTKPVTTRTRRMYEDYNLREKL
jgi:hypothetical protein